MKSVAVFNNKGGVGKTTLLCNLAAALKILKGHDVLVIDADPQCNATQNMFDDRQLDTFYSKKSTFTLQSIVRPLSLGKGFSDELSVRKSPRFSVDVLLGDPAMSLNEDLLASDWIAATGGNARGLRTTFLFKDLLTRCTQYDYVLFDMGPTLGAINRSVLLAVDYFLTPMSIDIFSLKAIDNISTQLRVWKQKLERGIEDTPDIEELGVDDPHWRLKFLGYVTQQYKAKSIRGERQAVDAYDKIMREMPKKIIDKLVDDVNGKKGEDSYLLGRIPLLHSLIPMSQTARAPIFQLKSADGVRGAHFARVDDYEALIGAIADRFKARVGD